jgi:hypothetical protein
VTRRRILNRGRKLGAFFNGFSASIQKSTESMCFYSQVVERLRRACLVGMSCLTYGRAVLIFVFILGLVMIISKTIVYCEFYRLRKEP